MLTCYGHTTRLPQSDLVYAAFRLAMQETLSNFEMSLDDDCEDPEEFPGFLTDVPFLQQVALPVQCDLLAETWTRHHSSELIEASLLDAAVVFAAFTTAARIIIEMPDLAAIWLADGPRKIRPRLLRRANHRLERMFDEWWDDNDFLMIDDLLDMPPEKADDLKALLRIPDEVLQPMFDVLGRWRVPEDLDQHLTGLLNADEIEEVLALLVPGKARLA